MKRPVPLLRLTPQAADACGVNAQKTNSLCCEAASVIDPVSATAEALIPHEKLREAASVGATLIARERPPAQLSKGYMHLSRANLTTSQKATFLAEILKKTICSGENVRRRSNSALASNHQDFCELSQRITRSHGACSGWNRKFEHRYVSQNIGIRKLIIRKVLERIRYCSAYPKLWALILQTYLKTRFTLSFGSGRRCLQPSIPLLLRTDMPYPLANVKCSQSCVNREVARDIYRLDALRKLGYLKLLNLPLELGQHVADSFNLKRSNRLRRRGTAATASCSHKNLLLSFLAFEPHSMRPFHFREGI